jgi:hypothetical protein
MLFFEFLKKQVMISSFYTLGFRMDTLMTTSLQRFEPTLIWKRAFGSRARALLPSLKYLKCIVLSFKKIYNKSRRSVNDVIYKYAKLIIKFSVLWATQK